MATLTNEQRRQIWAEYMKDISSDRETCSITKADLRAAFDALDDWFDANAATLNSALPTAARTGLTTAQKARLLMLVVRERYIIGA